MKMTRSFLTVTAVCILLLLASVPYANASRAIFIQCNISPNARDGNNFDEPALYKIGVAAISGLDNEFVDDCSLMVTRGLKSFPPGANPVVEVIYIGKAVLNEIGELTVIPVPVFMITGVLESKLSVQGDFDDFDDLDGNGHDNENDQDD